MLLIIHDAGSMQNASILWAMPLENTVTDSALALAAQMQPGSDWKWTLVGLGVMMLAYSLGKLCIRQNVAINGRVQTTVVLPKSLAKLLGKRFNIGRFKRRSRRHHSLHTAFTQQQRRWYAQLYSGQEIVFGTMLYIAGLAVMTQGGMRLFSDAGYSNVAMPIMLMVSGAGVASWGVLAVLRRNKYNPFVSPEPSQVR